MRLMWTHATFQLFSQNLKSKRITMTETNEMLSEIVWDQKVNISIKAYAVWRPVLLAISS